MDVNDDRLRAETQEVINNLSRICQYNPIESLEATAKLIAADDLKYLDAELVIELLLETASEVTKIIQILISQLKPRIYETLDDIHQDPDWQYSLYENIRECVYEELHDDLWAIAVCPHCGESVESILPEAGMQSAVIERLQRELDNKKQEIAELHEILNAPVLHRTKDRSL